MKASPFAYPISLRGQKKARKQAKYRAAIDQGEMVEFEAYKFYTDPDKPIWADGEYTGRTSVTIKVIPGALTVVAPE